MAVPQVAGRPLSRGTCEPLPFMAKKVIELKQTKEKLLQLTQQCWLLPLGSTAPGSFNIKLLLDLNGNPDALGILTRKVFIAAEVSALIIKSPRNRSDKEISVSNSSKTRQVPMCSQPVSGYSGVEVRAGCSPAKRQSWFSGAGHTEDLSWSFYEGNL